MGRIKVTWSTCHNRRKDFVSVHHVYAHVQLAILSQIAFGLESHWSTHSTRPCSCRTDASKKECLWRMPRLFCSRGSGSNCMSKFSALLRYLSTDTTSFMQIQMVSFTSLPNISIDICGIGSRPRVNQQPRCKQHTTRSSRDLYRRLLICCNVSLYKKTLCIRLRLKGFQC